jgi:acetyl/propionyl-CoA carboxylase alpha subunit
MAFPDKLLVANRGEIALRIIRSARLLGIKTVAIYSESEKDAGYVRLADEKISLGEGDLDATFLNIARIIDIAITTGSDAIHPGYGFLSENPDFATACKENKIIFVGPEPEVLRLMGNKPDAKKIAASLGIPVTSGLNINQPAEFSHFDMDFPAMIKASYGGGGKGIKIVENKEELILQLKRSSRMAREYFGNGEIFVEKYIRNARHVEVQILGDKFGNVIHLFERECSIQRNHQKIIEEAPALFLSPDLRGKILSDAVKIGKAVNYSGAGTVEFLVEETGKYFFMEMNPRIQVEHAVTEQVTGIDIVSEQLKIASGYPVSFSQEQVVVDGHAIETRVYAENPAQEFCPSSEQILSINLPTHPDVRIEADIENQFGLRNNFDPLLLKLISRGKDRESALNLLKTSVRELNIIGPETNVKYLEMILAHEFYRQNTISVEFCRIHHDELIKYATSQEEASLLPFLLGFGMVKFFPENNETNLNDPWKYTGFWRLSSQAIPVSIDNDFYRMYLNGHDRSKQEFSLNGITTSFLTEKVSQDCIQITIKGVTKKIYHHRSDQGEISISCENIRHKILFPGLLKHYPETGNQSAKETTNQSAEITSPLHGKILDIYISENQLIKKGDPLLVIEAMKTENHILAHRDARVKKITVKVGAQVTDRMPLIFLED